MSKLLKILDNPFLIIFEGFVAGAFLFWSMSPSSMRTGAAADPLAQATAAHISQG